MNDSKACSRCKQIQPKSNFCKDSLRKDGLSYRCKSCRRHTRQITYYLNPEIHRQKSKDWRTKNKHKPKKQIKRTYKRYPEKEKLHDLKRRAQKRANGIFLVTKKDLSRLLRQPCIYCGANSQHIDHIIPLAKGGRHSIGNFAPSCSKCNLSKSNKFIMEWKKQKRETP